MDATARPDSIRASLDETYDMTSAVIGFVKRSHRLARSSSVLRHCESVSLEGQVRERRRSEAHKEQNRPPIIDPSASRV